MRVTRKGQVTIPKHIRDRTGIHPGTEVDFVVEGGVVRLVKAECATGSKGRGEQFVRHLRQVAGTARRTGLTSDEIMDMTRDPFDDVDPG